MTLSRTTIRTPTLEDGCLARQVLLGCDDVPGGSGLALFAWMNAFSRELARFNDVGVLLDRILLEGRNVTRADAGTIFLLEGDRLTFSNIHNDTLFPGSAANKHAYASTTLPLDNRSIAGYVALERRMVNIRDMRSLPIGVPFSFNEALDLATGYRTVSTLTVPIIGQEERILGVMQLINSQPDGTPEAFTEAMETRVQLLATQAGSAIERGTLARNFILRMLLMAALRDPHETGPHVQRVGSYAAELYHCWAERHGVDIDELRYQKSQLRLAAMLHDVGKVGIADSILKKPGKLDPDEYEIMKSHCSLGADIFTDGVTEVDRMAREVALHHHEKWNGSGYTGTDLAPLAGEDIPLSARITAVSDVYDALCSRRSYKEAWTPDKALAILRQDAGTHFDPEIVDCFEEIHDTIEAIRARYPDDDAS
jgi:HD-GYP domain-containing protein (c-di-GMP phosphodiesterase class II)